MRMLMQLLGLGAMSLVLVGCVSQEKYNALKLDRDRYAERLAQAESEGLAARAQAESIQRQLDAIMGTGNNKDAMIVNLTQQNGDLQRQLDALNTKYQEAMGLVGRGGMALPEQLDSALREFAAQNPDLVDFDSARGIVKFKSDVTFGLGSAELTQSAKTAIGRFAQILNSASAANYELMVAGHTDNVRVSRPETIQAGHKDNWFLSAHRGISVAKEMMSQRVNPQRLGVVGYADQRPIASNGSDSGRAQNRRVEVLILPTTVRSGAPVTATETGPASAAPNLNKDLPSASTGGPDLNK